MLGKDDQVMERSGWLERLQVSIAAKVLAATGAVALTIFAVYSMVAIRQSNAATAVSAARDLDRIGKATAESIANWFEGRRLVIDLAAEAVATAPPGGLSDGLFRRKTLTDNFIRTYFGRESDGAFFTHPRSATLAADYDPRKRPWYRQARTHGGDTLTEPYIAASSGTPVVTLAAPLYRGGRLFGITGADFSIEALADMLQEADLPGRGHAFLVNARGVILVHSDPAMVGKTLEEVFGKPLSLTETSGDVALEGVPLLVGFTPIPDLPGVKWYVGVALDRNVVYAALREGRRTAAIYAALFALLALFTIWIALDRIVLGPLRRMTGRMRELANGDYEIAIPFTTRRDEIGAMARAVEVFRENATKIAELTDARTKMTTELQKEFGAVVDAAVRGDFERRVGAKFDDPQIRALADSVNLLVETIDRGLADTGRVLAALARTDLTMRIEGEYDGAFAKLKADINSVADTLNEVLGRLRETSHRVGGATSNLLTGATDLSARTHTQAGAIRGTAAAAEQLTAATDRNAADAETASARASEASHFAQRGGQVMAETTAAMSRMSESAALIAKIVEMIDGIAAQTAMVALNASIEAERAGGAGRSFVVVAKEVKALAKKATEASRDVKKLIDRSAADVAASTELVASAAESLTTMQRAILENSGLLDGIARASREQASAIAEINMAIGQIDGITQQNAGLVEEINAAMAHAQRGVSELDDIVQGFKLAAHSKK